MRVRSGLIQLLAVALAATACTGGDGVEPTSASPPTAAPTTSLPPAPATTAPPPTTGAPPTASLRATLQVDGRPLAGVEVFLGLISAGSDGSDNATFACTDDEGRVEFTGVPRGASLVAVTGPGIAGGCANPLFLDGDSSPPYPLATTQVLAPGESISGDRDLGIVPVGRLPGSVAVARESVAVYTSCLGDGDAAQARLHLAEYERLVEQQRADGSLTMEETAVVDRHTQSLRFFVDGAGACATTAALGSVPVLYEWLYTPAEERPVVTLVDAGSEPRRVLSYALTPGAGVAGTMRVGFSQRQVVDGFDANALTATIDVAFTTAVVGVVDDGYVIVSTTDDFAVRSSDPGGQSSLEAAYAALVGRSSAQLMAPSGEVVAVEVPTSLGLADDATAVLRSGSLPLPAEPVGVGATWTVDSVATALGVETATSSTYTLVAVEGTVLTIEAVAVHDVLTDLLDLFPGLDDADITMTQSTSGRSVRDLAGVLPVSGLFETTQLLVATATFDGVESTLEQTTVYTVEFPSPGAFGPPEGTAFFDVTDATHRQGDITYDQDPPVGGPHHAVLQNCGFYDEPVVTEAAVHSLEHGAVWITYRPGLAADQVAALRDLAAAPYTLVSPYPGLDDAVVASAWGAQLRLDSAFDPRLEAFVGWFAAGPQTPEPGAPCSGGTGDPAP